MIAAIDLGCIEVIMLQFVNMEHGTYLLAEVAIGTFVLIHLGIPEAFVIGLEGDGTMRTGIAAGIAPAAIGFVLNMYHVII